MSSIIRSEKRMRYQSLISVLLLSVLVLGCVCIYLMRVQSRLVAEVSQLQMEKVHQQEQIDAFLTAERAELEASREAERLRQSYADLFWATRFFGWKENYHPLDIACYESFHEQYAPGEYGASQIREFIWRYALVWRGEMERYLELITEMLTEAMVDDPVMRISEYEIVTISAEVLLRELLNSQAKWKEFRAANRTFASGARVAVNAGGTILSDYSAAFEYDTYRERAIYLQEMYDYLFWTYTER